MMATSSSLPRSPASRWSGWCLPSGRDTPPAAGLPPGSGRGAGALLRGDRAPVPAAPLPEASASKSLPPTVDGSRLRKLRATASRRLVVIASPVPDKRGKHLGTRFLWKRSRERRVLPQLHSQWVAGGQDLCDPVNASVQHAQPLREPPRGHTRRGLLRQQPHRVASGETQHLLWLLHQTADNGSVQPQRAFPGPGEWLVAVAQHPIQVRALNAAVPPDPGEGQLATGTQVHDMLPGGTQDPCNLSGRQHARTELLLCAAHDLTGLPPPPKTQQRRRLRPAGSPISSTTSLAPGVSA